MNIRMGAMSTHTHTYPCEYTQVWTRTSKCKELRHARSSLLQSACELWTEERTHLHPRPFVHKHEQVCEHQNVHSINIQLLIQLSAFHMFPQREKFDTKSSPIFWFDMRDLLTKNSDSHISKHLSRQTQRFGSPATHLQAVYHQVEPHCTETRRTIRLLCEDYSLTTSSSNLSIPLSSTE